jgi:hypothetical protein
MKRFPLFLALALAAGTAQAADGLNLSIGADYNSGDYGTDVTTTILSVPVTAKVTSGDWTFKASVPWMRVEGDPTVVPGLGSVTTVAPIGRRPGGLPGGPGGGTGDDTTTAEGSSVSGIGDLRLSATYSVDTGTALGLDLTANAKLATADEDKGLGTGANDYGVAVDVYRDFDGTLLFGGAGYTTLGESTYIDVENVANANAGVSLAAGSGRIGAVYDWREAAASTAEDRSEITGFYSVPAGERAQLLFYALKGFSEGSPDWGAGLNLSMGF